MASKYVYQIFSFQGLQKYPKIGIFGYANLPSGNPGLPWLTEAFQHQKRKHKAKTKLKGRHLLVEK
jgi:hypothetical protein